MSGINLEKIAEWIRCEQMTFSQAVVSYQLNKEEKQQLKDLLQDVGTEKEKMLELLLDDIANCPSSYYAEKMAVLFGSTAYEDLGEDESVYLQFVKKGYTLTLSALRKKLNLPLSINKKIICREEFALPEYSILEYDGDIVNPHRTDVFFFGAASCGKSSMVCSVIRELCKRGDVTFEPFCDESDKTAEYYQAVLKCTEHFYKTTVQSSADSLLFCQLKDEGRRRLTLIDSGRRGLADLTKLQNTKGDDVRQNSIYRVLSNDNTKMLFFLIDYHVIASNNSRTLFQQVMALERAVQSLTYDGTGKNNTKNCTMSRVKTLGLVFTKCDRQSSVSKKQMLEMIHTFIDEHLQNLLRTLEEVCEKYSVNEGNDNKPYIIPFTLGNFTVGNTLLYDPKDTILLTELILSTCPKQLWWNC